MNNSNAKPGQKKTTDSGPQPKAKSAKAASTSRPETKNMASDDLHLPVLVEFAYTSSALLVIIASLLVVIISIVTKATLLDLVIRTAVTILVIGGLLTLVSWQVSAGVLQASLAEQKEAIEKEKEDREKKEALQKKDALEMQEAMKSQEPIGGSVFEAE